VLTPDSGVKRPVGLTARRDPPVFTGEAAGAFTTSVFFTINDIELSFVYPVHELTEDWPVTITTMDGLWNRELVRLLGQPPVRCFRFAGPEGRSVSISRSPLRVTSRNELKQSAPMERKE